MTTSTTAAVPPPNLQPYACQICQSRFTRYENLKRHANLHTRTSNEGAVPCEFCHATFSRPDLRNRHVKRKHLEEDEDLEEQGDETGRMTRKRKAMSPNRRSITTSSADSRYAAPVRNSSRKIAPSPCASMEDDSSCSTDQRTEFSPGASLEHFDSNTSVGGAEQSVCLDTDCHPSISFDARLGANIDDYIGRHSFTDTAFLRWSSSQASPTAEDWFPSRSQLARGFDLYFTHVSHFVPFLHQSTFDSGRVERAQALSMLSLGFQYGEDPECVDHREGSGAELSARCFHQARHLMPLDDEDVVEPSQSIITVQSYLLLEICAMMYLCGKDSSYGLKMHSRMISLARSSGLMQPIAESTATHDLDGLWQQFIQAESRKRTSLAVHQIDALWYQFLSIPRSISHLEIKHDLPCPEDLWTAATASQWAHQRLITKSSSPSEPYNDVVRRLLSPNPDIDSLPAFDRYGTISIAQFLVSSTREISGWSTMTGRVSMERLEPLEASLIALGSLIRPEQCRVAVSSHAALCEATWQTAMIELRMWSPSHTGGIVEGSMDAVVKQMASLAPSHEFLLETKTAQSIRPHVRWFLNYLEDTINPDTEPPWLALYAYKAFLIALQLVRGGVGGAMHPIDVDDGDVHGSLAWARRVFGRRERWQMGRLIMSSLDSLKC